MDRLPNNKVSTFYFDAFAGLITAIAAVPSDGLVTVSVVVVATGSKLKAVEAKMD